MSAKRQRQLWKRLNDALRTERQMHSRADMQAQYWYTRWSEQQQTRILVKKMLAKRAISGDACEREQTISAAYNRQNDTIRRMESERQAMQQRILELEGTQQ